ncbi:hypothetical protein EUAN_19740 [Andreesenia angusta]|uniref:Lipoprotein n=1 Tax=Andreesenia angusta TaxID=39480 RepID=A0A1S1V590_9FIRM|nr:hypothetical protein [Andreesenia angusta]OHW61654.1 hypothetical protein EUAN_19740 [Andreesenia angusta]
MKKKLIMLLSVFAIMMFALAGCGEKTALTSDQFKSKMEEKGYEVQDATSQFEGSEGVKKVYIALKDSYQIEFYEMETIEQAAQAYNGNKANFEAQKGSSATETDVSGKNSAKYTLNSDGRYRAISTIENTFVYLDVESGVKDEVNGVLDELGY